MSDRSIDLHDWSQRLRSLATLSLPAEVIGASPSWPPQWAPEAFVDDLGHHRRVDAPLLAWVTDTPGQAVTESDGLRAITPDIRCWLALSDPACDVEPLLSRERDGPLIAAASLLDSVSSEAIETRTELELCALHAVWALARVRARLDWRERCLSVADWHTRELQPDNATNSPWGVHVFLIAAAASGQSRNAAGSLVLHAQSLVHNCMVMRGRPDRRSALILLDASRELEREAAAPPKGE